VARTILEPEATVRALDAGQVAQLIARLRAAVVLAESLQGMHAVYAAEANAYRQVLATLDTL
jgi:hypothetical protein